MQMGFTKEDELKLYNNYCNGQPTNILKEIVQSNFGQLALKVVVEGRPGYRIFKHSMVKADAPRNNYEID